MSQKEKCCVKCWKYNGDDDGTAAGFYKCSDEFCPCHSQKESEWEKTKKEFLKELEQALQNNIPHAVNTEFPKFLSAVEKAIDTIVSQREKEIAEEVEKLIKVQNENDDPFDYISGAKTAAYSEVLQILKH